MNTLPCLHKQGPSALIAEDEPLLANSLKAELAQVWPELHLCAVVGDGDSAVRQALQHLPQVLFLDIRMPGLSGLQAAAELADAWPPDQQAFPALVFVTAYDQYAVQAFEAQAVDYLLKPVQGARLQKTVQKLKLTLAQSSQRAPIFDITSPAQTKSASPLRSAYEPLETTLAQLRQLLVLQTNATQTTKPPAPTLTLIQASQGETLYMVPVNQVLYFEAADKYVRVLTAEREYLIRTPLKDLLPQLDAQVFWQIHRSTVVNSQAIDQVKRDDSGRLSLRLRLRPEKLAVSRLYAHLFRAM